MKMRKEADAPVVELDVICSLVAEFNRTHPKLAPVDLPALLEDAKVSHRTRTHVQNACSEIEGLRKRAEERKYQKSIKGMVSHKVSSSPSEFKSMGDSISFASHFILAFISSFLAGYYLAEYMLGIEDMAARYIVGGAMSFVVLIVESVLFIFQEQKRTKKLSRSIS
jgi:hypothetical protein